MNRISLEIQLAKAKASQKAVLAELFTCSHQQVKPLENTIDCWTSTIDYIATLIMERDNGYPTPA